jgi:CRP-like cAMP-binding protein
MQYSEAVAVLRALPMFAGLAPAEQKLLAFSSTYMTFVPGEVVVYEGDATDCVFVIDAGEVEISIDQGECPIVIGRLGKNELFGEMGVFRGSPRTATVRAVGEVKALRVEAELFLRLVTENADAARAVMRILSDRLALTTQQLQALSQCKVAPTGP